MIDLTPDTPPDDSTIVEIGDTADDVIAYLASHPSLVAVGEAVVATVGGHPARHIDLRASAPAFGVLLPDEDVYGVGGGDWLRVWVVDTPAGTVTLLLEVYPTDDGGEATQVDIDAALALVEPIIASLSFPLEGASHAPETPAPA